MTDRHTIRLRGPADLERLSEAFKWLAQRVGQGWTIEITNRRTTEQNARFWAMLSDIANQTDWHGMKLKKEDWKLVFLDALGGELRMVPNFENNGFVNLGRSSSRLSKSQMSDMMELMAAFGAERGVKFRDDEA